MTWAVSECWRSGHTDCQICRWARWNAVELVWRRSIERRVFCLPDRVPSYTPPLPRIAGMRQGWGIKAGGCEVGGDATDRRFSCSGDFVVSLKWRAHLKRIACKNRYIGLVIDIVGYLSLSIICSIIVHRFQPITMWLHSNQTWTKRLAMSVMSDKVDSIIFNWEGRKWRG